MNNQIKIPDLIIPKEIWPTKNSPRSNKRWLFKNGAHAAINVVDHKIAAGTLGKPIISRIGIISMVHDFIISKADIGSRAATVETYIFSFNKFMQWIDNNNADLDLGSSLSLYVSWSDWLCQNVKKKKLSNSTAYSRARNVGHLLDDILNRRAPAMELTRLEWSPSRQRKIDNDKQNLEATFRFGHLMLDICDGLPLKAIWGDQIPLKIPIRSGGELILACGRKSTTNPDILINRAKFTERRVELTLRNFIAERTLQKRYPFINLRILAEMLTFIAQTGFNLAQARKLTIRHFNFSSDVDGYKVKDYKHRRKGEVLFTIYKEYRPQFERYLEWRKSIFPEEMLLFPIVRAHGGSRGRLDFQLVKTACRQAGVNWISSSKLRNTRVNWCLRRSGDPTMTAEMAQHSRRTLLGTYENPSHQRALAEVTRFWQKADPNVAETTRVLAVAPGECDGTPNPDPLKPPKATNPDCVHPSGCLWCMHYRDIDSFDYVWALSCFRHLKILEAVGNSPVADGSPNDPSDHAVDRISKKLSWFRDSSPTRREWVEESLMRVEEEFFHPEWSNVISAIEGPQR